MRPFYFATCCKRVGFQSTHPLRGATFANFTDVSLEYGFNPRTPCEVRQAEHGQQLGRIICFNPRTPCEVRLFAEVFAGCQKVVSIHAPLARCDRNTRLRSTRLCSFNPRTPCEVRQNKDGGFVNQPVFQSTHPLRGATHKADHDRWGRMFQSTHPLRGATGWVADNGDIVTVSIHAPLARCDCFAALFFAALLRFQSTHPLRGATDLCLLI